LQRGQQRLQQGHAQAALENFKAALTYPKNLGVGRSNHPEDAPAQYWRGKALQALGRPDEARKAWTAGAGGSEGSKQQNEHRRLCADALKEAG
jgi:hypothetical protein